MSMLRWAGHNVVLAALVVLVGAGCQRGRATEAQASTPPHKLELTEAPPTGDVASWVRDEERRAQGEGRRVLVYVGATWCQPCQRFHRAAAAGIFDQAFPTLRLLTFDEDRDGQRLAAAGYTSNYIPLFVLPGPDGRATPRHIEGSIPGEGALAQFIPRLRALLAAP